MPLSAKDLDFLRVTPSEHNRNLSPNWRWERARWLLENKKRPRKSQEDPWVLLAYKFQQELDKASGTLDAYRMEQRFGGLFAAWTWYNAEESARSTRWLIEAYLCAGDSFKNIANRVGSSVSGVACYTKMFYDVVGKTKSQGYMLNTAIGGRIHFGLAEREFDVLWKFFGYLRGPLFLEAFINKVSEPGHVNSYNQINEIGHGMLKDGGLMKSLVAIHTIPVAYNQEIIFAFYNKMVEIEKKADTPGQAQNLIVQNMFAAMNCLQIAVGKPDRGNQSMDANQLAYYDGQDAELRAHEQVALALGHEPAIKDKLSTLKFPEATDGTQQGS